MVTQAEKASIFQALHQQQGAFIIPNPWDQGSAHLLEILGFKALATTSAGYAFTLGKADGQVGREQMMRHLIELTSATTLPVSADLENGFGDAPEYVAETILLAGQSGVVGGSIEDSTGRADDPIYTIDVAAERIRAAAEAARSLPFKFTLTARAENFLVGRADLKDTIKRLQAYQDAGADVLFAPGLKTRDDIAAVVSSVDRPVNVIMGMAGVKLTLGDLADIGVKRVSTGSSLARVALAAFIKAAKELQDQGTFNYADLVIPSPQINALFSQNTR
ncbi:isocitrate lyase/PEP mutase family protein [Glaciimonas soli]|uniref:Isocitrate lyase/phosphoenolpyruvate mutase family protein n=1 Tax=Glaciimonas soli TaxID=2590999 RepID=A0A843YUU7_9BURK|nr:isocitrate lyase/phosphoenolpyruvate mutase family protein [Glaciimonas soli]MQR01278.1 isocitrate lyase/phosphoenolpyruvate mutase family protein [Glaciimonas soli]